MNRLFQYLPLALLIAACGSPQQTPATKQETTQKSAQTPPASDIATPNHETVKLTDMDFYGDYQNAPDGETQKPLFHLHAKTASPGVDGTYSIEGVEATIFAKDDKDSDIIFNASRGTYNREKGAFLEGPITVNIGDFILELEDLNYYNPQEGQQGLITSDHDIKLNNPNLSLTGSSMRLDPATMNCTVTNVHAIIPIRRSQP